MSVSVASRTPDPDRRFLKRAMAVDMLDREKELDLARRWRDDGDEAALHELTTAYMRLVIAVAAKFKRYGLPFADLIQEGNIGLMKAAQRFEPERDVRFSTYASWWIRSCIQDFVLRNWSIVRTGTTSSQKSLFFNLRRLRALIGDVGGGGLSPDNRARIARTLKVGEHDVDTMAARLSASDRSLNAPYGEEGDGEWLDLLASEAPAPEEAVMKSHDGERRTEWLDTAISRLNDREQLIIRERRLTDDGVTLETLGKRLGISKERVRQIEHAALGKLRQSLTDSLGDPHEAGLLPAN